MRLFLFIIILVMGVKSTAGELVLTGKAGAQMHRYFAVCAQGKKNCSDSQCAFNVEKVKCKKPLSGAKTDADEVSCDFKCAGHDRHLTGAPALFLVEQIEKSQDQVFEHGMGNAYFADLAMDCAAPKSLDSGSCKLQHSKFLSPQLAEGKLKPQAPAVKNGSAAVLEGN